MSRCEYLSPARQDSARRQKSSNAPASDSHRWQVLTLLLTLLLTLAVFLLAGCGGPASTIFRSAAPTDAIIPYVTGSNFTRVASIVGLRGTDVTEDWRTPIGERDNDSASAIVDGMLYVAAAPEGTPAPQRPSGAVYAIRLSTGKILWRTPLPQADYRVGIAADATTIIAAAGAGGLYALDASTGAIRWNQAVTLTQDLASAPHLADGVVLALVAGSSGATTYDGGLSAWREGDGALLWRQSYGAAVTTNQVAAYLTLGESTIALAPSNGRQLWSYQSGRTVEGDGANNYRGQLIAANAQLALVQITFPVVSSEIPTKDYLAALDARTGTLLWKFSPGLDGSLTFGGPIFAGGGSQTTIFGARDKQIVALRGADGARLWKDDVSPYSLEQAASTDGVLFALLSPPSCELGPCSDPTQIRFEALNASTGAVYWERDVPDVVVLGDAG